jgi:hypothetical protein
MVTASSVIVIHGINFRRFRIFRNALQTVYRLPSAIVGIPERRDPSCVLRQPPAPHLRSADLLFFLNSGVQCSCNAPSDHRLDPMV